VDRTIRRALAKRPDARHPFRTARAGPAAPRGGPLGIPRGGRRAARRKPGGREAVSDTGFYEKALHEFEQGRFEEAARQLGQVLSRKPNDGPALVLMSRILGCMIEGPSRFDAVWTLPGK